MANTKNVLGDFFPSPVPMEGKKKTVEKNSNSGKSINGMHVLVAIVAAVVLMAGVNYAMSHSVATPMQTSTSPQAPPTNPQINGQPGTATPTQNGKETVEAGKITLDYITVSENSKITELKPNIVYIRLADSSSPINVGQLIIKKEDLTKISSLTIGKTTLTNFKAKTTNIERDQGEIEADITLPKVVFSASVGTLTAVSLDQRNMISGSGRIEYGQEYFKYNSIQHFGYIIPNRWHESKYIYISINSP